VERVQNLPGGCSEQGRGEFRTGHVGVVDRGIEGASEGLPDGAGCNTRGADVIHG